MRLDQTPRHKNACPIPGQSVLVGDVANRIAQKHSTVRCGVREFRSALPWRGSGIQTDWMTT